MQLAFQLTYLQDQKLVTLHSHLPETHSYCCYIDNNLVHIIIVIIDNECIMSINSELH